MTTDLQQSVQFLKGVGSARAELLAKLGINTIADLLFHFPRYYDDLTDVRGIDHLSAGQLQTVHGEIVEMESRERNDGRPVLSIVIADPKGKCLEGIWFGQFFSVTKYRYGQRVAFSGKPKWYRDHWQMNHPRVEAIEAGPTTAVRARLRSNGESVSRSLARHDPAGADRLCRVGVSTPCRPRCKRGIRFLRCAMRFGKYTSPRAWPKVARHGVASSMRNF